MEIGDTIKSWRKEENKSQREVAEELHFDRTTITKIENGTRNWPEEYDEKLARLSWKLALKLASDRSNGFIPNVLEKISDPDLHPSPVKEILITYLRQTEKHLNTLTLARHVSRNKQKTFAKHTWHHLECLLEWVPVFKGVLEEEFSLDSEQLRHEHEIWRIDVA